MSKLLQTLGLTGQLTGTQPNTQIQHRIKQSRVASISLPFDNILDNSKRLKHFKDVDSFIPWFFDQLELKANDESTRFKITVLRNIFIAKNSNDGQELFDRFLTKFKEEYNKNPTNQSLLNDFLDFYIKVIKQINNFPSIPDISNLNPKTDTLKILNELSKYNLEISKIKDDILREFHKTPNISSPKLIWDVYLANIMPELSLQYKSILGDSIIRRINTNKDVFSKWIGKIKAAIDNHNGLLEKQMIINSNYLDQSSIFLVKNSISEMVKDKIKQVTNNNDIQESLSNTMLNLFNNDFEKLLEVHKINTTNEAAELKNLLSKSSSINVQAIFKKIFRDTLPQGSQLFLNTYINNNLPWKITFKEFKIEPIDRKENNFNISWKPEIIWNNNGNSKIQEGIQKVKELSFRKPTILISKLLNKILDKFKNNIQNINHNINENSQNTQLIDFLIKHKNDIQINNLITHQPFKNLFDKFKNEASSDLNLLNNKFYNNKTPDEVLNEVLKYIKPSIKSYDEKAGKISLNIDYYGSIDQPYLNKFYIYEQNSINKQANNINAYTIIKEFNDIFSSLINVNKPIFNEELDELTPNPEGYIPIIDSNNIINDNLKIVLKSIFDNSSITDLEKKLLTKINKGSLFLKKESNLINFYIKANGEFDHYSNNGKPKYIKSNYNIPLINLTTFKDYLQKQFDKLDIENKNISKNKEKITNTDLYKIMPSLKTKFDLDNFMKNHSLSIETIDLKEDSLDIKFNFKNNLSSFEIKKNFNANLTPDEKQKTIDELRKWISNEKQFINILKDKYLPKSKKEIINDLNKLENNIDEFAKKKNLYILDQTKIKNKVKNKISEINKKIENKINVDLEKLNKDEIDKIRDFVNKNINFLKLDKNKKYNIKEIENKLHEFLTSKKLNKNELNNMFNNVNKQMDTITKYGLLVTGTLLGLGSLGMGGAAISGAATQSALAKSGANIVKKSKALIALDAGLAIIAAAGSIGLFIFLFIVKGGI